MHIECVENSRAYVGSDRACPLPARRSPPTSFGSRSGTKQRALAIQPSSGPTLDQVIAGASRHRVTLSIETAGYISLAIADAIASDPAVVAPSLVCLTPDGDVMLRGITQRSDECAAEQSLRALLLKLLRVSSGRAPALAAVANRASGNGLECLIQELETSLIPVNRAAARRAMARVARDVGRWVEREPNDPVGEIAAARCPKPRGPRREEVVNEPPPAARQLAPMKRPVVPKEQPVCFGRSDPPKQTRQPRQARLPVRPQVAEPQAMVEPQVVFEPQVIFEPQAMVEPPPMFELPPTVELIEMVDMIDRVQTAVQFEVAPRVEMAPSVEMAAMNELAAMVELDDEPELSVRVDMDELPEMAELAELAELSELGESVRCVERVARVEIAHSEELDCLDKDWDLPGADCSGGFEWADQVVGIEATDQTVVEAVVKPIPIVNLVPIAEIPCFDIVELTSSETSPSVTYTDTTAPPVAFLPFPASLPTSDETPCWPVGPSNNALIIPWEHPVSDDGMLTYVPPDVVGDDDFDFGTAAPPAFRPIEEQVGEDLVVDLCDEFRTMVGALSTSPPPGVSSDSAGERSSGDPSEDESRAGSPPAQISFLPPRNPKISVILATGLLVLAIAGLIALYVRYPALVLGG